MIGHLQPVPMSKLGRSGCFMDFVCEQDDADVRRMHGRNHATEKWRTGYCCVMRTGKFGTRGHLMPGSYPAAAMAGD